MDSGSIAARVAARDAHERLLEQIGFDLHDGLAQDLGAMLLRVSALRGTLSAGDGPEEAERSLASIETAIRASIAEVHDIISQLRPRALDADSLGAMLRVWMAEQADPSPTRAILHIDENEPPMSRSTRIALFRIVQQACRNASEHGRADSLAVDITFTDSIIRCQVWNEGDRNGSTGQRTGNHGIGLSGIQSRAEWLGGTASTRPLSGGGFEVDVRIPICPEM